jgi:two-component system chemotaxis response regulator CheB
MAGHDVVVIGTSAGGVEVLTELMRGLPPGLPAALFIACHFPAGSRSVLPDILSRSGPLLATHARDGEPINPGHVYVAPPGRHVLLQAGRMLLGHGPREHGFRPAIDPLFRSAARAYGPRVIGVVLTGALHDGVAGLMAVRGAGGIAVIQDPRDALVAALPQNASDIAGADYLVPARELAPLLVELVRRPVAAEGGPVMLDPLDKMVEVAAGDAASQINGERRGQVSVYTCPECGGSLWQVDDNELVRFRCHVGHVYNGEALLAEQADSLEAALWLSVRTFRDRAVLARQLATDRRRRGQADAARRFEEQAEVADRYGSVIQEYLLNNEPAVRAADPSQAGDSPGGPGQGT